MSLLLPGEARGPRLDLELPESLQARDVVVENLTTSKSLTLELPANWDGDDLTLDWHRRTITDQTGVDRSDLLSASDNGLWAGVGAFVLGASNDIRIEVQGGSVIAADDFNQTAGNLTGKTTGTGGLVYTVVAGSDSDDFTIDTVNDKAQRTAVSDASVDAGRAVVLGATDYTNTHMEATWTLTAFPTNARIALVARLADLNKHARLELRGSGGTLKDCYWLRRIAGVTSPIEVLQTGIGAGDYPATISMEMDLAANGDWKITLIDPVGGSQSASGNHADLNAAGPLKQGKVGIYDAWATATAGARSIDQLRIFDPVASGPYVAKATLRWEKGYY